MISNIIISLGVHVLCILHRRPRSTPSQGCIGRTWCIYTACFRCTRNMDPRRGGIWVYRLAFCWFFLVCRAGWGVLLLSDIGQPANRSKLATVSVGVYVFLVRVHSTLHIGLSRKGLMILWQKRTLALQMKLSLWFGEYQMLAGGGRHDIQIELLRI